MIRFFILFFIFLSFACHSTQRVEKSVITEDKQSIIYSALKQIQKGKDNNKTQNQIFVLHEAFNKYQNKTLDHIKLLKNEQDVGNQELIYQNYKSLFYIQQTIKKILPLYYEGKQLKFKFKDISSQLIRAKQAYISLYTNQKIKAYELSGQLALENFYATLSKSDKAFDITQKQLLRSKSQSFSSAAQVHINALEDIKFNLKSIFQRHQLRLDNI